MKRSVEGMEYSRVAIFDDPDDPGCFIVRTYYGKRQVGEFGGIEYVATMRLLERLLHPGAIMKDKRGRRD